MEDFCKEMCHIGHLSLRSLSVFKAAHVVFDIYTLQIAYKCEKIRL